MKKKIITLISLCFYQVFSLCSYREFYQGEREISQLEIDFLKKRCSSIQLTDKEKEIDKLNYKPNSCCTIILQGSLIGPKGIYYENEYLCAPAENKHLMEYLRHYGSNDKTDCIYCNNDNYCASYFIKYYKFSLFLLFFLLLNYK